MAFDDFSKQIFKQQYEQAVITEVKVGQFEKSFDLCIQGTHRNITSSDLIPPEFKNYAYNLIEYKSDNDSYTHVDIIKLIGDFAYFCTQNGEKIPNIFNKYALWFIISNSTYLFNHLNDFGLKPVENRKGFYFVEKFSPCLRVLILEELESDDISNSLLLLMASPNKFCEFISAQVNNNELIQRLRKFINRKFLLEGRKVRTTNEVLGVKNKVDFYANENIKESIEDLGIVRVIEAVGLPRVIKEIGLDALVDTLDDAQKEELVQKIAASSQKKQKQSKKLSKSKMNKK